MEINLEKTIYKFTFKVKEMTFNFNVPGSSESDAAKTLKEELTASIAELDAYMKGKV